MSTVEVNGTELTVKPVASAVATPSNPKIKSKSSGFHANLKS